MDILKDLVLKINSQRYEEDIIDRWNYQLTAYIFAFSSLIITSNTYMGKPIICWTPAEFRGGWNEYARDYCLIENTYYVPMDDPSMPQHYVREREELPYYQWVQFVLVILAFLFFLPHLLWRSLNWWSGVQVRAIVSACAKLHGMEQPRKDEELEKIVGHIYRTFYKRHTTPYMSFWERLTFASGWMSFQYVLMKFLFIFNIVFQLVILHVFLGFDWGDLFSLKLGFNTDWKATGLFPRSTMCDFEIRNKGNLQRYSVQCVLSQNMFNEKIFLVLFYWLIVLFVITIANTALWIPQIFFTGNRRSFTSRMLESAGESKPPISSYVQEKNHTLDSMENYKSNHMSTNKHNEFLDLSPDLVVLLRLISSNAGDSICSDVTRSLYYKCRDAKDSS